MDAFIILIVICMAVEARCRTMQAITGYLAVEALFIGDCGDWEFFPQCLSIFLRGCNMPIDQFLVCMAAGTHFYDLLPASFYFEDSPAGMEIPLPDKVGFLMAQLTSVENPFRWGFFVGVVDRVRMTGDAIGLI